MIQGIYEIYVDVDTARVNTVEWGESGAEYRWPFLAANGSLLKFQLRPTQDEVQREVLRRSAGA